MMSAPCAFSPRRRLLSPRTHHRHRKTAPVGIPPPHPPGMTDDINRYEASRAGKKGSVLSVLSRASNGTGTVSPAKTKGDDEDFFVAVAAFTKYVSSSFCCPFSRLSVADNSWLTVRNYLPQ